MVMRKQTMRASLLVLALGTACSRKVEEPDPVPRTSASGSATLAGSSDPPLTPKERKEISYRLHNEACEAPVKHINAINGRKETDPAVIDTLSLCLARGNVAWSRCVMASKTNADISACSSRFLLDSPR